MGICELMSGYNLIDYDIFRIPYTKWLSEWLAIAAELDHRGVEEWEGFNHLVKVRDFSPYELAVEESVDAIVDDLLTEVSYVLWNGDHQVVFDSVKGDLIVELGRSDIVIDDEYDRQILNRMVAFQETEDFIVGLAAWNAQQRTADSDEDVMME